MALVKFIWLSYIPFFEKLPQDGNTALSLIEFTWHFHYCSLKMGFAATKVVQFYQHPGLKNYLKRDEVMVVK